MKVIEITLAIPYKEGFCLPAFTGVIEGYTGIKILAAGKKISELEVRQNLEDNQIAIFPG